MLFNHIKTKFSHNITNGVAGMKRHAQAFVAGMIESRSWQRGLV